MYIAQWCSKFRCQDVVVAARQYLGNTTEAE